MEEQTHEPCSWCKRHRDAGDLKTALKCISCGGTGIIVKGPACNGCGGSLYPPGMNSQIAHGLENVVLTGGYDSTGLLDLHRYTFSLCETCIRTKVLMTCKIPPKVEDLTAGGQRWEPVPFAEDQEMWEYAEWRRSGGHATASLHRLCNAILRCGKEASYSVAYSGEVSDDCLCEDHKDRFRNCLNAEVVPFMPWQERPRWKEKSADGG